MAQRPPAASCTTHGDSGVNGSQMFDIVTEMATVDHTCTEAFTTAIYSVPVREQSVNDAELGPLHCTDDCTTAEQKIIELN